MTTPGTAPSPEDSRYTSTNVSVSGDIFEPGPDGRAWVRLTITVGLVTYAIVMPVDGAIQMKELLPNVLESPIQAARLKNAGIVVATEVPQHPLGRPQHPGRLNGGRERP